MRSVAFSSSSRTKRPGSVNLGRVLAPFSSLVNNLGGLPRSINLASGALASVFVRAFKRSWQSLLAGSTHAETDDKRDSDGMLTVRRGLECRPTCRMVEG
jgi:hypothetical protein